MNDDFPTPASANFEGKSLPNDFQGKLTMDSTVLAVVPHFRCEQWLADCLDSLVSQSRPLQGIVVIDDGSEDPPVQIVRHFPGVTLLASDENVGPYRLLQQVINEMEYDAYLLQDADDWSTPARLETLLLEAERSGAEYIGSQVIRILSDEHEAVPMFFPLDVNAAQYLYPTANSLLHATGLIARSLVLRIGGYATGLRFGADVEFLRRATYVARVVNSPRFCYFYRSHPTSLTASTETGFASNARQQLQATLFRRSQQNARRVAQGKKPLLKPFEIAGPIGLRQLVGPPLRVQEHKPQS